MKIIKNKRAFFWLCFSIVVLIVLMIVLNNLNHQGAIDIVSFPNMFTATGLLAYLSIKSQGLSYKNMKHKELFLGIQILMGLLFVIEIVSMFTHFLYVYERPLRFVTLLSFGALLILCHSQLRQENHHD